MKIGWIGLGKMGLPMSLRLRDAGHTITAYARGEAGRDRAKANGYAHSGDIGQLVADKDLIVSAISDDAALMEICGDGALSTHMRKGQSYIETSTVSPAASATVAGLLAARGVAYLRAPVSGSTALAAAGTLTTMVSGPREAFDDLQPIFAAFTRKQFYLGAGEEARVMKLAVNAMVGATAALVAETLAFSSKGGIDRAAALEVITQSAVASPLIDYKRATILEGRFDPAFEVMQMMKDFDILLSVGRANHAPQPLASLIRQQYEAAFLHGNGEKDFFVLVKEAAELAGVWKQEG